MISPDGLDYDPGPVKESYSRLGPRFRERQAPSERAPLQTDTAQATSDAAPDSTEVPPVQLSHK